MGANTSKRTSHKVAGTLLIQGLLIIFRGMENVVEMARENLHKEVRIITPRSSEAKQ